MRRFYRLASAQSAIDMPYWFARKEQPWSRAADKPVKYRGNWYHSYLYTYQSEEYLVISSANRLSTGDSEAIFFKLKTGDLTQAITVQDLLSEKINPEIDSKETVDAFLYQKYEDSKKHLYQSA